MKSLDTVPTLTERVYQSILDEILDGTLAPGEHLVQEQLASDLGVSRQPVQQAMARLKADGVVEETGRRGLTVAALDLTQMQHHYDIRAVLDGHAAHSAAAMVSTGKVSGRDIMERAQPILAAGAAAIRSGSTREQIRHDEALHKLFYDLSGNPVLATTAEPNWRFMRRAMADVLRHAAPPRTIWEQHRAIVDAIAAGEPAAAEQHAKDHVRQAARMLSDALETGDAALGAPAPT